MKSKIYISIALFVMFVALLTTSCFAVSITEKTDSYQEGALIYGSTRFESDVVITAAKAYDAGVNEAKLNVALGKDLNDIKPVTPFFFDGASWYQITESETEPAKPITKQEEIKEIEENLNIFFVNNEVKTLEVKYTGDVDKDSISNNVKYDEEKGIFIVPAITFNFTFEDSTGVETKVATNVDTNIKEGKEPTVEDVDIIPEWAAFEINGEYYAVDTVNKAFASEKELEVKLLKDVDLPTAVKVTTKVVLDLNGKTLTAKKDTAGDGIFMVVTGGDLTINGEGTIDSACQTNNYSMAIWAKETGKVTINGGTFTNRGAKDKENNGEANNNELIYARDAAVVIINGGEFIGNIDNEKYGARYALNLRDQNTDTASIIVKGGIFVGYNPANSASENPRMNFLADGYKVVLKDNTYTVVKVEETDVVLGDGISYKDLQTAVDLSLKVKLLKDIDLPTAVEVTKKVTVDLNGKTLTSKTDTEGNGIFWVKTGGDLTINGEGTIDSACLTNDYSMAIWATETGKVTINGGTFTNKGAKSVEDDGKTPNNNELIYASVNAQIVINGGTFIGNIDNEKYGARYTLNLKDKNNNTSSIVVKGGTFTGYDPANSKSENPTKNLVAEGYKVVVSGDKYTVVAE